MNEVELVVKDVEQTEYDNPHRKLIFAHESANVNNINSEN